MDSTKTPLAVAVFMVILYVVCALGVWLSPSGTMYLFQSWFHGIDLNQISTTSINGTSFIVGLISSFVVTYIFAWIFVKVYQAIAGK